MSGDLQGKVFLVTGATEDLAKQPRSSSRSEVRSSSSSRETREKLNFTSRQKGNCS
jgi:hypothetical protein